MIRAGKHPVLLLLVVLSHAIAGASELAVWVDLSGSNWRFHEGDNPVYAQPSFDDSGWEKRILPRQQYPPIGVSWMRTRFVLPVDSNPQEPLALTLGTFAETYEVFSNGVRIGGPASTDPTQVRSARPRTLPIPAGLLEPGQPVVLAIRITRLSNAGPFPRQLRALPDRGPYLLTSARATSSDASELGGLLRERLAAFGFVTAALRALLFLFLLTAWITEPRLRNLLVLATLLAADCGVRFLESLNIALDGPLSVSSRIAVLTVLTTGLLASFALETFQLRKPWIYAAIWIPTLLSAAAPGGEAFWPASRSINGLIDLATVLLALYRARIAWRKTPRQYGPFGMALAIAAIAILHSQRLGFLAFSNLYWFFGGYLFHIYDVVVILISAGMTLHLLLSLGADRREKERLAAEMDAARVLQKALLTSPPETPDFIVEAIYEPAQEVGGDFYWTRVEPDGAITVAVGDVSGKGLRAAMLVAVVMGILRQSREGSRPAELLTSLNRALSGQTNGGFVTCCCLQIEPGGSAAVIANAGHIAPYIDSVEVSLNGLPLGVHPDADYDETTAHGQRFTVVSDGVVEAAKANHELFGFDRTREISTKSAKEIAEAARAWGQNDDITVVTLRRRSSNG